MARKKIDAGADVNTNNAAASYIQEKKEKKDSTRVQILISDPESWKRFQAFAHLCGSNPNALINEHVRKTVEQYASRIDEYERQRDAMKKALGVKSDE